MNILSSLKGLLGFQNRNALSSKPTEEIITDDLKYISSFEGGWDCVVDEILLDTNREAVLRIGDHSMSICQELPWIPKAIGRLVHLEELYIRTTEPWPTRFRFTERPTEMPESFSDLVHLEILNLRGSRITKLPETIGNLSSLVSLDLQDTPITSLPDSFANLKNLERLSLFATLVDDFTILRQLPNLREIQLGGDIIYWGHEGGTSLLDFKLKYCTHVNDWSERDRKMLEDFRISRTFS